MTLFTPEVCEIIKKLKYMWKNVKQFLFLVLILFILNYII